jgi:hypothetical protein
MRANKGRASRAPMLPNGLPTARFSYIENSYITLLNLQSGHIRAIVIILKPLGFILVMYEPFSTS